jgi:hypothetical protein
MMIASTADRWIKVIIAAVLMLLEYIVRLWVSLILRFFPASLFTGFVAIKSVGNFNLQEFDQGEETHSSPAHQMKSVPLLFGLLLT